MLESHTPVFNALRGAREFAEASQQMVVLKPKHGIMALPLGASTSVGAHHQLADNNNKNAASGVLSNNSFSLLSEPSLMSQRTNSNVNNNNNNNNANNRLSPDSKSLVGGGGGTPRQLMEVRMVPVHGMGSGGGQSAMSSNTPRRLFGERGVGAGGAETNKLGLAAIPSPCASDRSGGGISPRHPPSVGSGGGKLSGGGLSPPNQPHSGGNSSKQHIAATASGGGEPLCLPPISPRNTPR